MSTKPWRLKSRLYKPSPPARTNGKLRVLKPAEAGYPVGSRCRVYVCVAPDFQSVGDQVQDLSYTELRSKIVNLLDGETGRRGDGGA